MPEVGFQDLPPDASGAGVVTHAAPSEDRPAEPGAETTAVSPSLPGAAVILHPAAPKGEAPEDEALQTDDTAYAPPPEGVEDEAHEVEVEAEAEAAGPAVDSTVSVPDVVVDEAVRRDVVLMVGASALVDGPPRSGMTGLLVDRIVESVSRDEVTLDRVLVLTTSDTASADVTARLRTALENALAAESEENTQRRLGAALVGLRSARIGPPVRVAAEILARRAVPAGVDPMFRVLEAGEARRTFDAQWERWLESSATDRDVETALRRGVSLRQIRRLAETLTAARSLLPVSGVESGDRFDVAEFRRDVGAAVAELVDLAAAGAEDDDGVLQIRTLQRWWDDAAGLDDDDFVGHLLHVAPLKIRTAGSRAHWDPPDACVRQMAVCKRLGATWSSARIALGRETLADTVDVVSRFVLEAAGLRRRAGTLTATDVLVDVRNLLRDDEAVLGAERDLLDAVFVDDVWDVDPVALEIVRLLAGTGDDPSAAPAPGRLYATGSRSAASGRLRGDLRPALKLAETMRETALTLQTDFRTRPEILAWRNTAFAELFAEDPECQVPYTPAVPGPADRPGTPGAVDDAEASGEHEPAGEGLDGEAESPWAPPPDRMAGEPAEQTDADEAADPHEALSTNEIPLMRPGDDEEGAEVVRVLTPEGREMAVTPAEIEDAPAPAGAAGEASAPAEVAEAPPPLEEWPAPENWTPVVAVLVAADGPDAVDIRAAEAYAAAQAVRRLVDSGTPLLRDELGRPRPATWSDCAVLAVSPLGLYEYEGAFDSAGIPLVVPERNSGLDRPEVDDLVAVLRAADEPGDRTAVVAALRGLAFGCTDDELAAARAAGSELDPLAPAPAEVPEPVRHGLEVIARLHAHRSVPAPELVSEALAATGLMQAAACLGDTGRAGAAIRHLHSRAVQVCGAEGAPVRRFLRWIDASRRRFGADTEALLPEGDSVLLATAGEARGAEFPVVILVNSMPAPSVMPLSIPDHVLERLHLRVGRPDRGLTTPGFDAALGPDDDRVVAGRTRLALAGTSRARDLLIVPVAWTGDEATSPAPTRRDLRRRLARHLVLPDGEAADGVTVARLAGGPPSLPAWTEPVQEASAAEEALREWQDRRRTVLEGASHVPTVSALGRVAPAGLAAAFRTALGRADFTGAADPAELAFAACAELHVPDAAEAVTRLVDSALSTHIVRRAASAERVLRNPTVALDGGAAGVFWSRVDLAFEEDGALVTVQFELGGEARDLARLALATHTLAEASGVPVGEAVAVEIPGGDATSLGPADVAAHAGRLLAVEKASEPVRPSDEADPVEAAEPAEPSAVGDDDTEREPAPEPGSGAESEPER